MRRSRETKRLGAFLLALLTFLLAWLASANAEILPKGYAPPTPTIVFYPPPDGETSEEYVYVCDPSPGSQYRCGQQGQPSYREYGPISFEGDYIPHVLANEWDPRSGQQAFRAGAIAIRTFGWRETGGCGAVVYHRSGPDPSLQYRVEHNWAQTYWDSNIPGDAHYSAVEATEGRTIHRSDGNFACAKYRADRGNPTAPDSQEPATLISVPDPVDTNYPLAPHEPRMSQNGSHAWELGSPSSTSWNYPQILTHYYTNVSLKDSNLHDLLPPLRWTWLDVGDNIVFTGFSGEQYRGPISHTPTEMVNGQILMRW